MLNLINNDIFYDFNTFTCELNDDTKKKCKPQVQTINFISDIFSDCKEFIEYYNQKYENLKTKIDNLKVKDIQRKYLDDYKTNYKTKIDECKTLSEVITKNITTRLGENKIKREELSSIKNITEKITAIRESETLKKSNLEKLKHDKTLEQIEAELKAKLELLKSGSYNL
jgi:hypothetical protein